MPGRRHAGERGTSALAASMLSVACTVVDPSYVGGTGGSSSSDATSLPVTSTSPSTTSDTTGGGGADATTGSSSTGSLTEGQTTSELTATGSSSGSSDSSGTTAAPGCQGDVDCLDTPGTPACDLKTGECVVCIDASHCSLPAEVCLDQQCTSYGQPCLLDAECNEADGEECCTAAQCTDACIIPCQDVDDCPPNTDCQHSYCLPSCNADNADCVDFPGFTCQHPDEATGIVCEND